MTVAELIIEMQGRDADAAQVDAIRQLAQRAEQDYEKAAERKSVDAETLSRTYSL